MEKYAVIVAGGSGLRMGTAMPKQFLLLGNKPVLWHTLNAFLEAFDDLKLILVLPEAFMDRGKAIIHSTTAPARIQTVQGGDTRFQSVKNGLAQVAVPSVVFVHDGVRCLITPALIRHCYSVAIEKGNAIPAITAMDSIRIVTEEGSKQVDRNTVRLVQTPQTFLSDILKAAYEQPFVEAFTDEATVAEKMGVKINLVEGDITNIKITRASDLLLAEKILEQREPGSGNAPAV